MKNCMNSALMILFLGLFSACTTQSKNIDYKLFPVSTKTESNGNGFVDYTVQMGIENTSNHKLHSQIYLGKITLETQEGYTYQLGSDLQVHWRFDSTNSCTLPPAFRKIGSTYTFRIGETLHPTSIVFGEYGSVSVNQFDNVTFPTSQPESLFLNFPYTITLKDATLTIIGNPKLEKDAVFWFLGIETEFVNNNPAESKGGCLGLTVFDRFGTCHNNQIECGLPRTGPLQTSNATVWLATEISPSKSIEEARDILRDAKVEITWGGDQYIGIFNLKFP